MDPATVIADPTEVTLGSTDTLDPNGHSTFTYTGPHPLHPGSIFVTDTSGATGTNSGPLYGFVATVDGQHVTTNAASLMDIYPNLDLNLTADAATGTVTSNTTTPPPRSPWDLPEPRPRPRPKPRRPVPAPSRPSRLRSRRTRHPQLRREVGPPLGPDHIAISYQPRSR